MSFRIEHRTGVAVPSPVVWEVLRDLDAWPSWNPVYPTARGRLGIGERLDLVERAGGAERDLVVRVIDWVPNEQILWSTASMGGLARRLRFIELEALSSTGCVLSNGEIFSGMLANTAYGGWRRALSAAYAEMNEALRARAEAAWAAMDAGARATAEQASPIPEAPVQGPTITRTPVPPPIKGYFGRR